MNEEVKQLVPKLRFKEFSGNWKEKKLKDFIHSHKGGAPLTPSDFLESGCYEVIPKKAISSGGKLLLDKNNPTYCKKSFFENYPQSIVDSSYLITTLRDLVPSGPSIGYIVKFKGANEYLLAQGVYGIKFKKEILEDFVIHYSNTGNYRVIMQKKMVGSTQVHIRNRVFFETKIPVPTLPEQTKIAACLSSLDDLITAQTQKIEALKTHKKGLMQQIFPQEGETVPKLRFPEFLDSREWKKTKLGQLGELVSGLTYSPDDVRDKGLLVLRYSNVQNGKISLEDNVYVSPDVKGANLSKPNDILICVRNGSKALIGKNALIPEGMPLCTHGAFMTVFRSKAKFVFQLFQTNAYESQVAADLGATINSINGRHLINYDFYVPTLLDEQQKIADCLSSLDDLITAQTKKLELLKTHKKGLMQGLFPVADEK